MIKRKSKNYNSLRTELYILRSLWRFLLKTIYLVRYFFFLSTRVKVGKDSLCGSVSLLYIQTSWADSFLLFFLWSSTDSFCRYLPNTLCQALCLHNVDTMVKNSKPIPSLHRTHSQVGWYIETMCSISIIATSQRIRIHSLVEYVS